MQWQTCKQTVMLWLVFLLALPVLAPSVQAAELLDEQGSRLVHTTVSQNFGISAVKPTSDGKYIVVGENYISKMNKARAIEWSTLIFEEESDRFTSLNYVMQARDDGYLFAGRDFVRDQWIYGKLDAGGSYMFVKETGDYSQGSAAAIFEDTNGFFVIGYVGSGAERDIQLLWTDHNGNKITDKRISRTGEQYVRDVQKIGNNYLIIGDSGSLNTNGYTVMIDQAGNIVRDFISVGTGSTTLQSAYILEDGSYFLTGSDLSSGQRALLIKVNANHEQEWMRTYPSQTNSNSLAYHIASTLDGGYIIAGGNNSLNGMLLKIDANGNRQWEKWFAGTYNLRFVEQLEDGSYLTAGNAASGPFLHVKVGAPAELSVDDASNTIIGLTEAMEYSLDNGTVYTPYLSSAPPIFPGDLNVLVRYKQDWSAGYEAGAPIELKFTQNAIAASVSELDKLIVPNGTELSALELPEKVEVTLSDDTTLDVAVAWDNGTPAYNGTVAGTYLFKGDLALPVGIDNPQELAASIVVEVEEAPVVPVTVKSVAQMDKLIVPNGTELSALELPEKVEVTLSDDTTLEVAVSWDNGTPAYNGTVAGTYQFKGDLALPTGIENPQELVASIEVEVKEAPIVAVTVESVAQLDKLIVPNGTERSALELPEKVEVTLSDDITLEVAVAWDNGTPAYNGTVAGTYLFRGNLALPAGIENPQELVASIEVEVEEAPIVPVTVESVAQLDKLIMPNGTELSALALPEKVEVTLSDDTTLEVAVAWDNGTPAYNGTVAGTYQFKGELALPAGIDNPQELTASIEVEVEEAPVVPVTVKSVAQLDKLIMPNGTELSALALPEKVKVTLSDDTTLEVAVSWDNGTPAYNGTVAGTYLFRGNLALPAGIENPGELVASIEVEVKEAPIVAVTVESVAQLDKLIVPNGTELSAIELPEKVKVTLSDNTTLEVAVTWDNGTPAYNGTVAGTYQFKGELALPAGIDNPQELTASIEVEVEEAPVVPVTVKSVAQLDKLIVPIGTELSALALPEKVKVTLSDDTTLEVAVSWDNGTPAYNGTVAGTYQFKGELALPAGINNPQGLVASIEVEVEEAPIVPVTVESVAQLDKLIVPNGTERTTLELPEKVEVTLSDNTTLEVAVTWDNGTPAYNGTVAGTYQFKGNLALPAGISNPQELVAGIEVEVEEAQVVPVTVKLVAELEKLTVTYGTELSALELPKKVKVTLSDDTALEVAVTWDNGTPTYNGAVAGTYQFKGNLALPAGIDNPQQLAAGISVEVARQVISPQPSVPSNKLYLYCNEIGCSTSYGNELKVEIGSNAYDGPFTVSIEKLALSEQQRAALPAESQPLSAGFELLKSFEGSLKQPARLSFAFDESKLQQGYRAALHYYDPVQAEWLEIAGEVDAGTFVAEVDQFATFALLAVKDEALPENPSPEPPAQFNDTANHWAQLAIKRAAAIQLVDGFADGSFRPDESITREQFITILARALGWTDSAAKLDFQDADTVAPWAAQAVAAAVEHQVIQGYADGTVRPSEAITRAEMVAFISRAVEWDDHNAEDQALSSFTDHAEVPKWASTAFAKAVEEKLIVGSSSQKLEPLQIATRAEAVVMLIRLLDLLGLNS